MCTSCWGWVWGWVWIVGQSCGLLIWSSVQQVGGIPLNLPKWMSWMSDLTPAWRQAPVKLPLYVSSHPQNNLKRKTLFSPFTQNAELKGGRWATEVCPKSSLWTAKWGLTGAYVSQGLAVSITGHLSFILVVPPLKTPKSCWGQWVWLFITQLSEEFFIQLSR